MSLFVGLSDNIIETSSIITLNSDPLIVESLTPSSASPILTETLTVQLGSSYDTTNMEKEDFSVVLIPRDGSKVRPLNVVDISKDDGTLDVKYGGAYSGMYDIQVSHTSEGSFLTSDVEFEAKIQIESFSPTQGAKFGGTLVTITGGHFSDNIQDNPVKIDYTWVGGVDHYCYVKETSDNEIKCRMATDYNR